MKHVEFVRGFYFGTYCRNSIETGRQKKTRQAAYQADRQTRRDRPTDAKTNSDRHTYGLDRYTQLQT